FWLSVYQGRRCPGSDSALSVPVLSPAGPLRVAAALPVLFCSIYYISYNIMSVNIFYLVLSHYFKNGSKNAADTQPAA
ncbi:MAG: hypothetical protein WAX13_01655, partial [Gemmiger qucibialis]